MSKVLINTIKDKEALNVVIIVDLVFSGGQNVIKFS